MPELMPYGFATKESTNDPRTVPFQTKMSALLDKGGFDYLPEDIRHQWIVGICTSMSTDRANGKANSKDYSEDFDYLLQKVYYDKNWDEGSSGLHALKVRKKFGFLLASDFKKLDGTPYIVEADRKLKYSEYVKKLQAIPMSEIERLGGKLMADGTVVGGKCVDRIAGYTQLDVNNPMSLAQAINESKSGILARFECGKEWWTAPINPLRSPQFSLSGHLVVLSKYDFTESYWFKVVNSWGKDWNLKGLGDVNWYNYRPTEAWAISLKEFFTNDLRLGMTHPDVKRLQVFLNANNCTIAYSGNGSPGNETTYFGEKTRLALVKFQELNGIQPAKGFFGPITRNKVNQIL